MKNAYEVRGDVIVIFINRRDGVKIETLIDKKDFDKVNSFEGAWCSFKTKKGHYYIINYKNQYLHRFITEARKNYVVDHINHNTLDNRRSNLRVVTNSENLQNRLGASSKSVSGIRGVYWHKGDRKWRARVRVNGKEWSKKCDSLEEAEKVVKELRMKHMPFSRN